jgi:ChrB-like protein
MPRPSWVLLSSRLPRKPSRLRLAVWRRLKRTGAVLLHDAVWVLPADPATREAVEWLAEEIVEQGGTAFVWEAAGLSSDQDRHLVELFRRDADARYAEIEATARAIQRATAKRLRQGSRARPSADGGRAPALKQVRGLERALRLERRRDYFRAHGRAAAVAAVSEAVAALEAPASVTQERSTVHALGH